MRNRFIIAQDFSLDITDPRIWGFDNNIKLLLNDDLMYFINVLKSDYIERQNKEMEKVYKKNQPIEERKDGKLFLTQAMLDEIKQFEAKKKEKSE